MSINSVRPCRKTSPDHLRVLFLCNESHRAWRGRHSAHVPRAFCQILLSGYTRGITSTPDVSRARDSAVCLSPHVMPHVISRVIYAHVRGVNETLVQGWMRIIWIRPPLSVERKIWITYRLDSLLVHVKFFKIF